MGTSKPTRSYLYIAFALIMLIVSWESNLASAALMNPIIPEQSIRIRILANSDRVEDQWIKKEIRDAITANVNGWNLSSQQIEDARNEVNRRLPELSELVGALLAKYDFTYGYEVELSKVHFPAKIFGHVTYPAGEYEALRITLGEGKGQNWWCVLFPPLCFGSAVKAVAVEGVALEQVADEQESKKVEEDVSKSVKESEKDTTKENGRASDVSKSDAIMENKLSQGSSPDRVYQAPVQDGDDVEVKFFLWDMLKKFGGFIKNMFS